MNWAIINGESHAAISVHEFRPDLDAGGILYQELVPIGDRDNVTDLYQRLNEIQCRELPHAVGRLLDGEQGAPQDEAGPPIPVPGFPPTARSTGGVRQSTSTGSFGR